VYLSRFFSGRKSRKHAYSPKRRLFESVEKREMMSATPLYDSSTSVAPAAIDKVVVAGDLFNTKVLINASVPVTAFSSQPGAFLPAGFRSDQPVDKELDEPWVGELDFDDREGLIESQNRIWAEIQDALNRYPRDMMGPWFEERWEVYRNITAQIAAIELALDIRGDMQRIRVSKLPSSSGAMGSMPESDNPSGGGSPKQQGPFVKLEGQVDTLGGRGTRPGSGGTLGGGGGAGGTTAGSEGASQKGGPGGGSNGNDNASGWDNSQSGGDHDAKPNSKDGGSGHGAGGGGAGGALAGGQAGGTAGGGGGGGTTYYESRSQRDPWGVVRDGVEVEVERDEDDPNSNPGLPPADESGGGFGGNDLGAAGKLSKPLHGVTPQEKDFVGPAIGSTTGADDKDRPNVNHPGHTSSDSSNDLGNDLPGNRLRGQGGESMVSLGVLLYQRLGVDPGIAYANRKAP